MPENKVLKVKRAIARVNPAGVETSSGIRHSGNLAQVKRSWVK